MLITITDAFFPNKIRVIWTASVRYIDGKCEGRRLEIGLNKVINTKEGVDMRFLCR